MSQDMNEIHLKGRLGKDPELKYTTSGKAKTTFNVAVKDGWGDREHTNWIPVVVWGKEAEACATHLHKGDSLIVLGRLRQNNNSEGTRSYIEVVAKPQGIIFLRLKNASEQRADTTAAAPDTDDPIPF